MRTILWIVELLTDIWKTGEMINNRKTVNPISYQRIWKATNPSRYYVPCKYSPSELHSTGVLQFYRTRLHKNKLAIGHIVVAVTRWQGALTTHDETGSPKWSSVLSVTYDMEWLNDFLVKLQRVRLIKQLLTGAMIRVFLGGKKIALNNGLVRRSVPTSSLFNIDTRDLPHTEGR